MSVFCVADGRLTPGRQLFFGWTYVEKADTLDKCWSRRVGYAQSQQVVQDRQARSRASPGVFKTSNTRKIKDRCVHCAEGCAHKHHPVRDKRCTPRVHKAGLFFLATIAAYAAALHSYSFGSVVQASCRMLRMIFGCPTIASSWDGQRGRKVVVFTAKPMKARTCLWVESNSV